MIENSNAHNIGIRIYNIVDNSNLDLQSLVHLNFEIVRKHTNTILFNHVH